MDRCRLRRSASDCPASVARMHSPSPAFGRRPVSPLGRGTLPSLDEGSDGTPGTLPCTLRKVALLPVEERSFSYEARPSAPVALPRRRTSKVSLQELSGFGFIPGQKVPVAIECDRHARSPRSATERLRLPRDLRLMALKGRGVHSETAAWSRALRAADRSTFRAGCSTGCPCE